MIWTFCLEVDLIRAMAGTDSGPSRSTIRRTAWTAAGTLTSRKPFEAGCRSRVASALTSAIKLSRSSREGLFWALPTAFTISAWALTEILSIWQATFRGHDLQSGGDEIAYL